MSYCDALKELSARLPGISVSNPEALKQVHDTYDDLLQTIHAENETLAKPFRTASYDIGKWITSTCDSKTNNTMKKAWFEMAFSNLKSEIGALQTRLECPQEQS